MTPFTFSPIRVASCPAHTSRAGAIVPAFWLGACLFTSVGCGSTSRTIAYGGTASLEGSKGANPALAHQSVAVMSCPGAAHSDANGWPEVPEPFAILTVGDRCTIDGAWRAGTFLAETGGQCVLPFPDQEVTIRVTDAMARGPASTYIEVQIAGDTMNAEGPGEHVRYRFSGTIRDAVDANQPCLDALQHRKPSGAPVSAR
jgi:hypothetical protein